MPLKRDPSLIPLSHDHHHGLVRVFEIRQALRAGTGLERQVLATREHWQGELAPHFAAEEQVVFPAMASIEGAQALIARLIDEHGRLGDMAQAIAAEHGRLAAFADLLEAHIRAEERDLFGQYQTHVPQPARDAVGAGVRRILDRPE